MMPSRRIDWKAVDPPRRPVLFVNPRSGRGAGPRIAAQAKERGINVAEFGPDRSLATAIDEAVAGGADALAVAGGDGSLATVAAAALAHDLPFVCVPAGTRNHFARDLGLDPTDPIAALDALSDGVEGRIDVGEVNGRVFLNNVSLGIYAEAIRHAGYRDAKVRTLLETARTVLGPGAEISGLDLVDDLGDSHTDPAIVLVSNNPYALGGPPSRGGRPTLSGGRLGIIVIDRPAPGAGRQAAHGAPPRCGSTLPTWSMPGSMARRWSCRRRSSSRFGRRRCGSECLARSVPPAAALERGDGQRRQRDAADRSDDRIERVVHAGWTRE